MYRYVRKITPCRNVLATVTLLATISANAPITMADEAKEYRGIGSARITLSEAIDTATTAVAGQPLEAKFATEDGALLFRVWMVQQDSEVQLVAVDSRSGKVRYLSRRKAVDGLEEKLGPFFHRRPHTPQAPKLSLREAVVAVETAVIGKVVEAEVEPGNAGVFWYETKILNDKELQRLLVDPESGRFRLVSQ